MDGQTPSNTLVLFRDSSRPDKAVKRLRNALRDAGVPPPPLGALKSVFAAMCGARDFSSLVGEAPPGTEWANLLDHELLSVVDIEARRRRQAFILGSRIGIGERLSRAIIDFTEPTGNGTHPLRLWPVTGSERRLTYALPPWVMGEDGHKAGIAAAGPLGYGNDVYRLAGHSWVAMFYVPEVPALLTACRTHWFGMVYMHVYYEGASFPVTYNRSGTGVVSADEPRMLRPAKIHHGEIIFSSISCRPYPVDNFAVERLVGAIVAADMLQCAIWCLLDPRPAVVGKLRLVLQIDNQRSSRRIAESVDEWLGYAKETEVMEYQTDEEESRSPVTAAIDGLMKRMSGLAIEVV